MHSPSLLALISGLSLLSLASAKDITGVAFILVNNIGTGTTLGCLDNTGAWVNSTKDTCTPFKTLPLASRKRKDMATIWTLLDDPPIPCGFSSGAFVCSSALDTTKLSTWSLKSNVLSTDPQGREFKASKIPANATDEVVLKSSGTGTTVTLSWVNV